MLNCKRFSLITLSLVLTGMLLWVWASPAEALCVKGKRANLRQGPGLNYKKLWEVFKYMPFRQLGKKGDWLRIQDLDGDIYWLHKRLTTTSIKCAVIKQDKTNMRIGPGTHFKQAPWSPVDKYFSMKVLEVKKNWVRVVDSEGDKAWVYRPLVWIK